MTPWNRLYYYSRAAFSIEYLRARNRPNAVFIWVPKTAGVSLVTTLNAPALKSLRRIAYGFCGKGIVTFGHMDYAQLVNGGYISRSFDESAYKFAFVRNPYARAVSLHAYLKQISKTLPADESFLTFCRRLTEHGCDPIGLYNIRGFSQCNPQVRWLERTKLDYLGKVESLDEDAKVVLGHLGLPLVPIPRLNVTDHPAYGGCYCGESKEMVEAFYAEDFSVFNYDYEDFFESH